MVPAGVTSINITMSGGGGGGINRGGCAGVIKGVLPTNPGEQLSVIKGGEGNGNFMGPGAGGAGGGGAGGNAYSSGSPDGSGSGGGGGSFLFGPQGLIMAAGGGGGESGNGGYGGSVAGVTATFCPWVGAGQTGSGGCGAGGQPGTGSAGGQGGIEEAGCQGSAGTNGGGPATSTSSLGTGGTGGAGTLGTASSTGTGGGGGGGGYYGGGGGGGVYNSSPNDISGAGGAGSNYGNPKLLASYTVTNTSNQNNGYVDLSYTPPSTLISGTIVTPFQNDGWGGATVEVTGTDSTTGQTIDQTTMTASDGTYSIGLDPGSYTVTPVVPAGQGPNEFTPTGCGNGTQVGGAGSEAQGSCANMTLSADQGDTANFSAGYTVGGTVKGPSGPPGQRGDGGLADTEQGATHDLTATTNADGQIVATRPTRRSRCRCWRRGPCSRRRCAERHQSTSRCRARAPTPTACRRATLQGQPRSRPFARLLRGVCRAEPERLCAATPSHRPVGPDPRRDRGPAA